MGKGQYLTGVLVLRPGAAPGYCVGLLTPASLAGDCREPMSRAQHPPVWRSRWRYAIPSLARGNTSCVYPTALAPTAADARQTWHVQDYRALVAPGSTRSPDPRVPGPLDRATALERPRSATVRSHLQPM